MSPHRVVPFCFVSKQVCTAAAATSCTAPAASTFTPLVPPPPLLSSTFSLHHTTPPSALHIYTDGACRHNGSSSYAVGGVGVFVGNGDKRNRSVLLSSLEPSNRPHTNQRAELAALILATQIANNNNVCTTSSHNKSNNTNSSNNNDNFSFAAPTSTGCSSSSGSSCGVGCIASSSSGSSSSSGTSSSGSHNNYSVSRVGDCAALFHQPRYIANSCCDLYLYTDSHYARMCVTEWIYRWKKNGWKNQSGEDVKNRDLIQLLADALEKQQNTTTKHNNINTTTSIQQQRPMTSKELQQGEGIKTTTSGSVKQRRRGRWEIIKVEGHGSCYGNVIADKLATDAIRRYTQQQT
eukprot:GHVS01075007.1.p1 GENE.GHVS01075007.1~~GHVS01075007.1.p1  ORF type:complete len:408 (+),score=148.57 GHVS01075007.1:176-1225(+)